jgi:hypothetical protein
MKPIGKIVVSPVVKKRRRARRVAESLRGLVDLYERYEDVRKNGGTSLDELTRKIGTRHARGRQTTSAVTRAH